MKDKFDWTNRKLVREIAIILVIKVACLMVIKAIWFSAPTVPEDTGRIAQHIAGN